MAVEPERIRKLNDAVERADRRFVLYWAGANRRVDANHGLLYAVELANKLNLPVLCYEGVTCAYQYANDRLHTFLLEGVPETAKRLKKAGIGYAFYLRTKLSSKPTYFLDLAKEAAAIVADDYPVFVVREMNTQMHAKVDVPYYVVDSSCVVPMALLPKRELAAYTIRPKIHRLLPKYFRPPDALRVKRRYLDPPPKFHVEVTPANIPELVRASEIDHSVPPSSCFKGGRLEAEKLLEHFLEHNLKRFDRDRNEPAQHATSHLSPYLHFGQISSLEVALAVKEHAAKHHLMADGYLEELIVRRELSFNYVGHVERPERLENLPDWARATMQQHAKDKRDPLYSPKQMEAGETYDDLWNATQKEMLLRGKIHGYYRMYWGKKILEWSRTYQEAVDFMIDMHGKYSLDGRDPNTFTNVLWCFGLHDRAWGERPIFGKIRYMSGASTKRKTDANAYMQEIAELERTGTDPSKVV
jgi:deoxyribodipyrimidine photo-lyase